MKENEQICEDNGVLIIDDNSSFYQTLILALEMEGKKVYSADNPEDALDILAKKNIKLLLADASALPNPGSFFSELNQKITTAKFGIIALGTENDRQKFITDFELFDFIVKPFEIHEIIDRVNNYILIIQNPLMIGLNENLMIRKEA